MSSEICVGASGTTFAGPDAVLLHRAMTLRAALKLAQAGIRVRRGLSRTRLLEIATQITGKPYGRQEAPAAIEDLTTWIDTMKLALPITTTD